tara:strand:+ start:1613 stop:1879 length:267 start_codon:yes stop_codon:yes gene_type:complete
MESISIIWPKKEEDVDSIVAEQVLNCTGEALNEAETHYEVIETDKGETVLTIDTHNKLNEAQSNEIAENIANKLFDMGFSKFDIEISV